MCDDAACVRSFPEPGEPGYRKAFYANDGEARYAPRKPRFRILIVDDEEGIRESLSLVLSKSHEVLCATDGEEAIAAINRQGRFDLILLDIKMPKLDGLAVLRKLKARCFSTPIIMLTAYPSVELIREALRLGALDYIPKPFTGDQVISAVHSALKDQPSQEMRGDT